MSNLLSEADIGAAQINCLLRANSREGTLSAWVDLEVDRNTLFENALIRGPYDQFRRRLSPPAPYLLSRQTAGFGGNWMSALPPKADMCSARDDVCFGPIADMCGAKGHVALGQ